MQTTLLQREDRRKSLLKQWLARWKERELGRVPESAQSIISLFLKRFWLIAAGVGRARACRVPGDKTPLAR
jgi:hypothetical protein